MTVFLFVFTFADVIETVTWSIQVNIQNGVLKDTAKCKAMDPLLEAVELPYPDYPVRLELIAAAASGTFAPLSASNNQPILL